MSKVIGVIGLVRFGSTIAKTLFQLGHKVLAIDNNESNIDSISNSVTWARKIDYTRNHFIETGEIDCSIVVIAIGHSFQENLLVTMIMKELKIKRIVSRSIDQMHAAILEKIGVDKIINPEQDMGVRLANQLVSSDVLELIEISPDYSVHHMVALPDMI